MTLPWENTMTNQLNAEIEQHLKQQGAAIIGFADLSDLPADVRDGYRCGISIAVELNPNIVNIIGNGPSKEYYHEYKSKNDFLNQLAENCASLLKTRGFSALAKIHVVQDEKTKTTKLPHKTVATKAGLGWIGKCALLITEEYGPAIRITSVLTDADLDVGKPIIESRCGDCEKCKNICPAGAVTGKQWEPGMNRDDFYHALDCRDKIKERGITLGLTEGTCGLCFWVCPWTQKHLKKSLRN
jgi:epoxyqueuosine reductase